MFSLGNPLDNSNEIVLEKEINIILVNNVRTVLR